MATDPTQQSAENPIDWSMLTGRSSSQSGIPGWAQNLVKRVVANKSMGLPAALPGMWSSFGGLQRAPQYIKALEARANSQAMRDAINPMRSAVQSAVATAAGRGLTGSSIMGGWMRDIAGKALQSASESASKTGIWANQALLGNLAQQFQGSQGIAQWLASLLGQTSISRSSAYDPSALGQYVGQPGGGK